MFPDDFPARATAATGPHLLLPYCPPGPTVPGSFSPSQAPAMRTLVVVTTLLLAASPRPLHPSGQLPAWWQLPTFLPLAVEVPAWTGGHLASTQDGAGDETHNTQTLHQHHTCDKIIICFICFGDMG
jgi:hypothetical protein